MGGGAIRLSFYRVRRPLKEGYALSLGRFTAFRGLVCRAEDEAGAVGWGESVPLPGYSEVDERGLWSALPGLIRAARRGDGREARRRPFVWSALLTALEHLRFYRGGFVPAARRLVAGVSVAPRARLAEQGLAKLRGGCRTLKVKVGICGLAADIRGLRELLAALPRGVRLRIDANQAYGLREAVALWEAVEGPQVEFLEQPFERDRWDLTRKLARVGARILLDESIWSEDDLERAAEAGVGQVKLKLFKLAGPRRSIRMIARARRLGLGVIWGNGFSAEIGNWHELLVARLCRLAGDLECNGYLRLASSVLAGSPALKGRLSIDPAKLARHVLERREAVLAGGAVEGLLGDSQ